MSADQVRRLGHGTSVTFGRVASCPFDNVSTEISPAASEVRLTGTPESLDAALTAVKTVKSVAADRVVSGFFKEGDGFVNLQLGSSAAQSVILMAMVIALTAFQFRYIERKVHYG